MKVKISGINDKETGNTHYHSRNQGAYKRRREDSKPDSSRVVRIQQRSRLQDRKSSRDALIDNLIALPSAERRDLAMHLQCQFGNRRVQKLIVHAKLKVGSPGDEFEQEADLVANMISRVLGPGSIQKMAKPNLGERQPSHGLEISPELEGRINSLRGGGRTLDAKTRAFFEPAFGRDLSGVRIHEGAQADGAAKAFHARALTIGQDIVFQSGQFSPGSSEGRRLLAHELTHVVQQNNLTNFPNTNTKSYNKGKIAQRLPKNGKERPDFETIEYLPSSQKITLIKENPKKGMASIQKSPIKFTKRVLEIAGLDAEEWYTSFTDISFLGRNLTKPIHTDLAAHLKDIEKRFAIKYGGHREDPAVAGKALGINEIVIGSRQKPTSASVSMHLFGLAIDINYTSNPFISASANEVFKRAGLLVNGEKSNFSKGASYDKLAELDLIIEKYFSYISNDSGLVNALNNAVGFWKGKTPSLARKQIECDLNIVSKKWGRIKPYQKNIIKGGGFLDLRKELVDGIGLAWGGSYGDMMHFDMRNKGNGLKIQKAIQKYKREVATESKKKGVKSKDKTITTQ